MTVKTSVKTDQYQGHDYYLLDELLSEDHLLAREAVRDWVKDSIWYYHAGAGTWRFRHQVNGFCPGVAGHVPYL